MLHLIFVLWTVTLKPASFHSEVGT